MERVAAAAREMAADLDLLEAGLGAEPPDIVQAVTAREAEAFMVGKIGRSLRHAARREVGRRRADDAPCGGEFARDRGRVVGPADAQRHIEPVLPEFEAGVGQHQMNRQRRMPCCEFGQQRGDPAPAQFHRRPDLEKTAGGGAARRDLGLGVAQIRQDAAAMLVIERALVGQPEAPRAALGESHAKARLQRRQPAADRRRRGAQRERAGGDAAGLHDGPEKLDIADAIRQFRLPCFRSAET